MAVVQLDPVSIDPVSNYGTDDDETRRRREAEAAALEMMRDPSRGEMTGLEPSRPRGAPISYAESAAQVAPEEVAPRMVRRPENAPTTASAASSPALMQTPPSGGGAPKPSSGRIVQNAGTDKDLERAMGERDSRRTRNRVVDAIGLLFGGGHRRVTDAVGGAGDSNQPLEDLAMRRGEEERLNAAGAARTRQRQADAATAAEAQYQASLRDPGSDASRQAQELLLGLPTGLPEATIRGLSAEQIQRSQLGPYIIAAQNNGNRRGQMDDQQAFQGEDREDTQAHQLQLEEMRANSRRELAELVRQRRAGRGGGGGGGGNAGLRDIVMRGLMAGGMEEPDAAALVSGMNARTLQAQANTFSGAVLRGAAEGGERAQNRNIDRATRYARETADVAEVEQRVGSVQRLLQGASDGDVREAIGAMQLGETAIAALVESNPRAGQLAMAVSGLQNAQLRIQSGAAVSNQEFSRFRTALGTGSVLSANAMRYGVQATAAAMQAQRQQFDTAYRDIIEWEAAGRPAPQRNINLPGAGGGAQPAPNAASGGNVRVRFRRAGEQAWRTGSVPADQARNPPSGWEYEVIGGS